MTDAIQEIAPDEVTKVGDCEEASPASEKKTECGEDLPNSSTDEEADGIAVEGASPYEETGGIAVEGAMSEKKESTPTPTGGKAHLNSSVPKSARLPHGALTKSQMAEIRSIFGDMDDSEIHRLYKKVTQ